MAGVHSPSVGTTRATARTRSWTRADIGTVARLGLILTVMAGGSVPAWGRAWLVREDGTGDAPTIQAAVNRCVAGDSVLVNVGSYVESVTVDVPISVVLAAWISSFSSMRRATSFSRKAFWSASWSRARFSSR